MAVTSKTIVYKQPGETLALGVSFANMLQTGETISGPTISSCPTGLGISDITTSGDNTVLFTAASGVHGVDYRIQSTVTSSSTEILQADSKLYVRER